MKILGICGSLRLKSSNGLLLKAAESFLNQHQWSFADLSKLPYFQPENQFNELTPNVVTDMRREASIADLIIISTPEYAHGIPGVLKNGLEWLFCEGTMKKKVIVLVGSGQGEFVREQLVEVLQTMDFQIDKSQTMIIQGNRTKFNQDGFLIDAEIQKELELFLTKVVIK